MSTFTYSEARRKFASLLDRAKKEGKILIKRKDGSVFELKALSENKSPLDVKGIDLNINREEILDIIKEARSR